MADQAEALRQLVQRTDSTTDRSTGRVVLVVGARPSVGATTVSENLALAFRRENRPTVLVDADLDVAGTAATLGIPLPGLPHRTDDRSPDSARSAAIGAERTAIDGRVRPIPRSRRHPRRGSCPGRCAATVSAALLVGDRCEVGATCGRN